MQITIPEHLKQNDLLKSIDILSYVKYVNYTPLCKGSVKIESNALIYVIKGMKILHFGNLEKKVKAGDVLFVKRGNYIMTEVLDEVYKAFLFFYSDDLLNNFINKYQIELRSNRALNDEVFIVRANSFLQKGLLSIIPYFENKELDKNLIQLKLEEIFLNILNSDENFKFFLNVIYNSGNSFKFNVEISYEQFETIKELADHFKMTEARFRSRFKEVFHTTPKKWILSQKLKKQNY